MADVGLQSKDNDNDNDNDNSSNNNNDTMTTKTAKKEEKQSIMKSIPSFLSPVGAMSRNYSVALDEDELMDLSPITPGMIVRHHPYPHPPLKLSRSNNNINRNNDRYWKSGYEANYNDIPVASTNEECKYNDIDNSNIYDIIDNDDDLPTPLLGYRNQNEDDDDDDDDGHHYYNRRPLNSRSRQQHDQQRQRQQQVKPKLNGLNYLNVITYVLNVFTSYFIGVRGLFGVLPTRRDIFIEYETLVTPADYAYWVWVPILVFEFFFATAQLFPHYRARPIIQQGTGLYFFWACIIQTIWTVFFAMRWFILSFVAVCLALLCLAFLLASQHYNCLCAPTTATATTFRQRQRKSLLEYWFFRFPFYLHCGWLLVCAVVQFSMVFRYRFTASSGAQLMADIVALGVLLPPSTFFLTGQSSGPDFVIPVVIIWSYISIGVELHRPSDTLIELYGHPAILAVQNASYVFTGLIGIMLIPRIFVWIFQEFCTIDVVELIDEEEDNISTAMNEVRRTGGTDASASLFHRFSLRGRDGSEGGTSLDQSLDDQNNDDDDDHNNNNHDNNNDSDDNGKSFSVSRQIIENYDEVHDKVEENNNNVNTSSNDNTNTGNDEVTAGVTGEVDGCNHEEKNDE